MMNIVQLDELAEPLELSEIVDKALCRLANSSLRLSAASVARSVGLHESEMARLRHLWRQSELEGRVALPHLIIVVRHLAARFPTMTVRKRRDGQITVRFALRNRKIPDQLHVVDNLPALHVRPPRPGTTRWFLHFEK